MNANKQQRPITTHEGRDTMNKLAYRDGSIYNDESETETQVGNQLAKPRNLAAKGLLFGITIAALMGLISGTLLLLAHQNQPSSSPERTTSFPHTIQP